MTAGGADHEMFAEHQTVGGDGDDKIAAPLTESEREDILDGWEPGERPAPGTDTTDTGLCNLLGAEHPLILRYEQTVRDLLKEGQEICDTFDLVLDALGVKTSDDALAEIERLQRSSKAARRT